MSGRGDFDVALAAWLDDGPADLPYSTRHAISVAVRTTPQARARLGLPARRLHMTRTILAGAAAIVLIGVGLAITLPRGQNGIVGTAEPTPSPTPTSTPTPAPTSTPSPTPTSAFSGAIDTTGWATYTSKQYGFTIGHPTDWTVIPATRKWAFGTDTDAGLPTSPGADHFTSPDGNVRVSAWTVALTPAAAGRIQSLVDLESWVAAYCQRLGGTSCSGIAQHAVPMCLGQQACHLAVVIPNDYDIDAFFIGGGRPMTVVAIWRGETDPYVASYGGAQRLLDAFLSTTGVVPFHT